METHVKINSENKTDKRQNRWMMLKPAFIFILLFFSASVTFGHCDTMDGPLIKDAKIALEKNNVNYVLKWVQPEDESEIRNIFSLAIKVRSLNADARTLSDNYFFETLVRLHRSGEGVPYTGVKPSGTPVDEKILAADKSVEKGTLLPLKGLVTNEMLPELEERFHKVMALKDFDVNNVKAGREYIEAYVRFFKYAEGEEEHEVHAAAHNH